MAKLQINKEIIIESPLEKVRSTVSNFNTWSQWSPWLICEPETKVEVNETGDFYSWEGKRVGSGQMKILNKTDLKIDYDLNFIKPWKSQANVSFILSRDGDKTRAKWTMESNWPFYLFFMRKKMEILVGMDYERGLRMLKEYVEEDKIHSQIEFVGNQKFNGFNYIGIRTQTTMKDMGEKMKLDLVTLSEVVKDNNIETNGVPFSQYHKFDFVSGEVEYTSGIPVKEKPKNLPSYILFNHLEPAQINLVRHKGKYEHLGNAWSTQIMMTRNKEFKQSKKIHPFEIYRNSPLDTPSEELITDVCFPLK